MSGKTHVLSVIMNREYPSIVKAENIYLYDANGKRYLDASSGPATCCLGYGLEEFGRVMFEQVCRVSFAYRMDFTTPVLEEAARRISEVTGGAMDKVFTVSGGSEATEIAVKIARKYHLDNGEPTRYKVISRWLSYHGMTQGALSWSGMTGRRADYDPTLRDFAHIAPGYCYRCWFGEKPETCALECAQALENEIMCQGPRTVAAFLAEPVSGSSLCAAYPRPDYFKKIREICDRHGVLLIFDEVLTGFGRTGKWFGYEHFGVVPDIMAVGKGMGGGYFPVGAALATAKVAETIAQKSGVFFAGYTWAGNPLAAAVVNRAIDYLREHRLVDRAAALGDYLAQKLEGLRGHPTVGEVRGLGLMRGVEFVRDKETRAPLDPKLRFYSQLEQEALKEGMYIMAVGGCDRGQAGDMVMFAPAYISTEDQIDEMVELFDRVLTTVERRNGF
ncbi:MAG: aminotransferase class III-fold pyridoxal phosphate-dependent enzyme [Thermodesulfobacteriota bacterium]